MDDKILIEKWKNGDEKSFDILFRKYYKPLCYSVLKRVNNINDAEEIVQDLFTEIYQNKSKVEIEITFSAYINRALYYKYLKFNKAKKGHLSIDENVLDIPENSNDPSLVLEQFELEQKVYNAIQNLPEKCRVIFELSRFKELKYREIADKLNISIKTVENQIGIALKIEKLCK